jgi:hypothetical protein
MMMVMTSTAIVGEDAISFVMIPSTIPLAGLRSSNLLRLLHVLHDLMAVVQFLWHTEIVTRVNDIWWLCFTYAACISIRLMHNILCHNQLLNFPFICNIIIGLLTNMLTKKDEKTSLLRSIIVFFFIIMGIKDFWKTNNFFQRKRWEKRFHECRKLIINSFVVTHKLFS